MHNIRQNLLFAFLYNGAAIPIAAGVLYPAFGIPIVARHWRWRDGDVVSERDYQCSEIAICEIGLKNDVRSRSHGTVLLLGRDALPHGISHHVRVLREVSATCRLLMWWTVPRSQQRGALG
jgi:hypothetical protein